VSILGTLVLMAFTAATVFMAGIAMNQEQQLAPRERQLLQQQR
jgi:hypothetical protein